MREVEVKYAIDAHAVPAVIAAVEAAGGTWSPAVRQDDQAYAESTWTFGMAKIGRRFARLRTENGCHTCTVKIPKTGEQDCSEDEWPVTDRAEADRLLRAQGFRPTTHISKSRRTAHWGPVTLCLDDVDGLGTFLEAEMLVDDDQDGPDLQDQLRHRLAALGLALTPVAATYDTLLHEEGRGHVGNAATAAADTVHR